MKRFQVSLSQQLVRRDDRRSFRAAVFLAAACMVTWEASGQDAIYAPPMAIESEEFLVKNNSSMTLRCSAKERTKPWKPFVTLAPGEEWFDPFTGAESLYLFCARPARPVVYHLKPGERYSLLRVKGGSEVVLLRVTPD